MNTPQIPAAFSSVIGLGASRGYFPLKGSSRWGGLVFFLIFLAGALLILSFGIYDAFLATRQHGPALIDDRLTAPLFFAFILFVLSLLAGWRAYANWNKGVAVYEGGFVYHDRKGLQAWRWEDVAAMTSAITLHYYHGIKTGTSHFYTLTDRRDRRLVLSDSFINVQQLADDIDGSIFPLLYARAAEQYNAGQTILFGPVAISKTGIVIGKKTYPWTDLKEVSIHEGVLKVSRKEGGWFSGAGASITTVPNLRVLLTIIQQLVDLKAV